MWYCDLVIYNKIYHIYLVFIPFSSTGLQKLWNFLRAESNKGIFCYTNEVDFWTPTKGGHWFPEEPTCDQKVRTFSLTFQISREAWAAEDLKTANSQQFNQAWLYNKAAIKTQKDKSQHFWVGEHVLKLGESNMPTECMEALCSFPYTLHFFHLDIHLYPLSYSLIELVNASKCFSEFCELL